MNRAERRQQKKNPAPPAWQKANQVKVPGQVRTTRPQKGLTRRVSQEKGRGS